MKLYTEKQLLEQMNFLGMECGLSEQDILHIKEESCISKIEINDNVVNHVMNDDTIEKLFLCETGHDIKRHNNGK